MLMTRDNPSIATKVNTMTSSVIILLLGNARLRCLCHRSVRQEKIIDSGVAELMQRVYLSCLYRGLFAIPPFFFEVLRVYAIFSELKSDDHKVTGSKPVLFRMFFFFVDFPVSGVVRAKPQKVELCCNVKNARWYASKAFPMEFLVRELVSGSRLV